MAWMLSRWGEQLCRGCAPVAPALQRQLCSASAAGASTPSKRARGHWSSLENRQAFLQELCDAAGGVDAITSAAVKQRGGGGLLSHYGGSLEAALVECFGPEAHTPRGVMNATERGRVGLAKPRQQRRRPRNFWSSLENQRAFLDEFALKKGIHSPEDWAQVRGRDLTRAGGGRLLHLHGGSLERALAHTGVVQRERLQRRVVQLREWAEPERCRALLERLRVEVGCALDSAESFAKVKYSDIVAAGGSGLLRHYGSVTAALAACAGDRWTAEELEAHRRKSRAYWKDEGNVRRFFASAEEALAISSPADWHRVSNEELRRLGGGGLVSSMPLLEALQIAFPGHAWDRALLSSRGKKAVQHRLARSLALLVAAGEPPAAAVAAV